MRGKAVTLFIREVSTVDEDYYYLTGKSWLGLFGFDVDDDSGKKTVQVVSKVISGHAPNPEQLLGDESVTIYLRQDPFQETIYISYYTILFQLGQIAGAVLFLYTLGFTLTFFWTSRLYNASLIKQLYTVKHTSAGRDLEIPPPPPNRISPL